MATGAMGRYFPRLAASRQGALGAREVAQRAALGVDGGVLSAREEQIMYIEEETDDCAVDNGGSNKVGGLTTMAKRGR